MELVIKGVHYHVSDTTKDFVEKKIEKIIKHAGADITSIEVSIVQEKDFLVESHVNMKWGSVVHVSEREKELYPAIEKMIKRLDYTIVQDKEKHQDNHAR